MTDLNVTFEELRGALEELSIPLSEEDRATYWVSSRILGIARTSDGAFEIFIVGPRLHPRTTIVRRHLDHGQWEIAGSDDRLVTNRIILPPGTHFLSIATLISLELLRAGLNQKPSLQDVFDEVEPIIELALQRGAITDEHIIGLVGELLCLEVMLDAITARPELRLPVLDMWQGHIAGRRDMIIGSASIEVKTTQQEGSSHKVSGLHQVEPTSGDSTPEEALFLLSIGLAPSTQEGQSLPDVVQRIVDRLAEPAISSSEFNPLQHRFLDDVAHYGATSKRGYDHRIMASWRLYSTQFRVTFTPRLYDLTDDAIRILRRRDIVGTHVSPDDIQYRIDLEPIINDLNPAPSWQHAIVDLVREALGMI